MQLGSFEIPKMDGANAAFGADLSAYPPMDIIPDEHKRGRSKGCDVFSSLFFGGGKLEDHGLRLKDDTNSGDFYTTLRAFMASFSPKHEHKEAACGWLIQEHTTPIKS